MLRSFAVTTAACALMCCALASWAQQAPDFLPGMMGKPNIDDSEWKEVEVPPPPGLRTTGLVQLEVAGGSELRFGIDPDTVAIGSDGVVRYVIVAMSHSGAVNALYEGVRCDKADYRVYARSSGQGWRAVETEWKSMIEGSEARSARAAALAGVCSGHMPNRSKEQIVVDLRASPDSKYGASRAP